MGTQPAIDSKRTSFTRGAWAMAASLACFTANVMLLKHLAASHHVGGWMSLLFRAVVGMAVLRLAFSHAGGVRWRRAITGWLMISRGVLGALGTAAYYLTIEPLGPGKATLICNTWVIWAALLAAVILHEHLSARKIAGILVAIGGLVLLTGLAGGPALRLGRYEVVAIAGALLAAATVVVIRQLTRTESSATIFASQCAFTMLLALPFTQGQWRALDATSVTLLVLAAVLAALGQIAMTEGFRHLPVAVGGAFQVLLPLTISLGSVALFDEHFTAGQIGGALLILAGCFLAVTAAEPAAGKPASSSSAGR